MPAIVAATYMNSYGKPKTPAMYDIDATLGAFIQQTKPNDRTLKTVGALGVGKAQTCAHDVHTTAAGKNTVWLVADNCVYNVSIESGKAEMVGKITGVEQPGMVRCL